VKGKSGAIESVRFFNDESRSPDGSRLASKGGASVFGPAIKPATMKRISNDYFFGALAQNEENAVEVVFPARPRPLEKARESRDARVPVHTIT
jgi:hypothetical protein